MQPHYVAAAAPGGGEAGGGFHSYTNVTRSAALLLAPGNDLRYHS